MCKQWHQVKKLGGAKSSIFPRETSNCQQNSDMQLQIFDRGDYVCLEV